MVNIGNPHPCLLVVQSRRHFLKTCLFEKMYVFHMICHLLSTFGQHLSKVVQYLSIFVNVRYCVCTYLVGIANRASIVHQ